MDPARIEAIRVERAAMLQRPEDTPSRAQRLAAIDAELLRLGAADGPAEPASEDTADHTPLERAAPKRSGRQSRGDH